MRNPTDTEKAFARQGKIVALVIVATMILWMASQWIGGKLGLPDRYVFLFDLLALAGFLWALIVTWQMWRKRQQMDD